jgi:L-alanine-DL-glutamate epimerase-like enolase superfamily enzyme
MKITTVETLCLSRLHERERMWATGTYRAIKADCAIVAITTDDGLRGIGEACAYGVPTLIRSWVDWLAPMLVGHDPRDPRIVPHPNGRSAAFDCAVAGIDAALWDLKGKLEGQRVCALLTDRPLDRVRLYASSGCRYDWRERPEQLIAETLGYLEQRFTACKVRIGTEWSWDGVTVDRFLGLMRELAQAVAGRMELMLDGNQRLTEDQALAIARELDRLGFTWFEQPIPQSDIAGYARLNAAGAMPITEVSSSPRWSSSDPIWSSAPIASSSPTWGGVGSPKASRVNRCCWWPSPNTTHYESLVMTNPVVREPVVDAQGLVHAPTAPSIGFQAHWGDTPPWESGPLVE